MMQAVLNTVNPIQTAIRSIFVTLDMGIYDLLKFMYELFFNIATNNLIDREMIFSIFSRVQLVIGIFMMFQLVMIVIKGIVNPDSATDAKSGGGMTVVVRIIVSLALLAVIVPINIPSPRNEYEKQINNNGLLFGTLYSLQYRILANNTLGRLILGNENEAYTDGGTGIQDLSLFANRFTSTIVRMFYVLNRDDNGNYVCNDGFDSTYNTEGIDPNIIIINGTQACGSGNFVIDTVYSALDPGQVLKQGQQYRITMNWLSTIIGIVLVVLFFMMIFNVAKRVFKLAALQLIAPIPIISYMDPKGSKDGAFNSWVKMLATTYLELFIQLAVVYFSFAIINSFIVRFFNVNNVTSAVGNAFNGDAFHATGLLSWTFIIMTIALFIFAKDAPKFLKQALGIKDNGQGFFSAFGTAMGLGVAAAGAIGSFNSSRVASKDATKARLKNANPNLTDDQAEAMARRGFGNRARQALSGLFGAGMGVAAGGAAASESKGNAWSKMMASANAMNKRNEKVRAAGRNGSTMLSGLGSLGQEIFEGQNEYDRMDADWKKREQEIKDQELVNKRDSDINAYRKAIMDRVNSKAVDSDKIVGTYDTGARYGTITGNYRNWHSISQAALVNGVGVYEIDDVDANGNVRFDSNGNRIKVKVFDYDNKQIKVADIEDLDFGMLDAAKEDYYRRAISNATFDSDIWDNKDAYERATNTTIVDHWGQVDGLKAKFGEENRRINKSNSELSKEREQINRERQGYLGQKAQYDAKRFRDK